MNASIKIQQQQQQQGSIAVSNAFAVSAVIGINNDGNVQQADVATV